MVDFPVRLLSGYQAFRTEFLPEKKELYEELARKGQRPETFLISCCDSRTTPEIVFNTNPGDMFVIRNIANAVLPSETKSKSNGKPNGKSSGFDGAMEAAVEFAVRHLQVKNIVVLGHAGCGGIAAALSNCNSLPPSNDPIDRWMEFLQPDARVLAAKDGLSSAERHKELEQINIKRSVSSLRTFSLVSELENQGKLLLYGAWFDTSNGDLWLMDESSEKFVKLVPGDPVGQ